MWCGQTLQDGHRGLACLSTWRFNNWWLHFIVTKNSYQERSVRLSLLIKTVWNFNVRPIFNWSQTEELLLTGERDAEALWHRLCTQCRVRASSADILAHTWCFGAYREQRCCHLIVWTGRNVVKDLTAVLGWLNRLCELCAGTLSIMQGMTALPLFPNKH